DTTEIQIGKKRIIILNPTKKIVISDSLIQLWDKQAHDALRKAEKLGEINLHELEKAWDELESTLEQLEIRLDKDLNMKIQKHIERLEQERENKTNSTEQSTELRESLRELTKELKEEIREKLDEKIQGKVDREPLEQPKRISFQWLGLGLGMGTWLSNGSFTLPPENDQFNWNIAKSIHVHWQITRMKVSLSKQVRLITGLGIEWQNYRFQKNTSLRTLPDRLQVFQDSVHFSKNKLTTQSLHIPILLQFQTKVNESNSFRVAAGGYANFLLDSWTKQVSSERGTVKYSDNFNLNRFTFGLTARIGYGAFNVYINYSLAPVFAKGRSIETLPNSTFIPPSTVETISPVAFGIEFLGF
ncbi:MAG: outer membrane beta-barrel protein, partial [Bacteroidia bacterium]|nr:outer membrane beta-barrel protein [Bacteroidia bacterium]